MKIKKYHKYKCIYCDYGTSRKTDYNKHIDTIKHIINVNKYTHIMPINRDNISSDSSDSSDKCSSCGSVFNHKSSLSRHKRNKCSGNINSIDEVKTLCNTIVNENRELYDKLKNIADKPTTIVNKNINIIQFLNHDCKDALNMSDFIQQIEVSFDDLMHIYDNGYLEGIKNTLIRNLIHLEERKRPIHCTDHKRKQFYIKDDNMWEKDPQYKQIENVIRNFNTKQLEVLYNWKDENDDWLTNDQKQNTILGITKECTKLYLDGGDKLKNKIINELSINTVIEKNKKYN
jgi:hypothetical protein